MSQTKAITDFGGYAAAELLPTSQTIQTALAAAVATFPKLPVDPPTLATKIETYSGALTAKESGAYADTIAFNIARHASKARSATTAAT